MADTLETLEIEVKSNAGGVAAELRQIAASVRTVGRSLSSTTSGIKNVANAAKKAKGPLETFISSLKRIAMYRILRSIIKSITQAFSEGLQNAYAFSKGIETEGNRFAAAMDSMKSAGTKMKNQLGSAFIALLAAIAPIVNAIISLVTRLANALAQLFSIFTGGTYLRAKDVSVDFADTMAAGAGAAKEWKNQLLGFDVINRLEEPSKGGGGGGAALDPMSMFEDTPIDGIFAKIKAKLDELKNSLDFTALKNSWDQLKESVQAVADTILQALGWVWDNIIVPLTHWIIEKLAPAFLELVSAVLDLSNAIAQELGPVLENIWNEYIKPIAEFIGEVVVWVLKETAKLFRELAKVISGEIDFQTFWDNLDGTDQAFLGLLAIIALVIAITFVVSHAFVICAVAILVAGAWIVKHWEEVKKAFEELVKKIKQKIEEVKQKYEDWKTSSNALKRGVVNAFESIYRGVATPIQNIVGAISNIISMAQSAISWLNSLTTTQSLGNGGSVSYNPMRGGVYASGGFPDEGELFLAREAGPEMVGTIGGRTAVANNADIVSAIEGGVYRAMTAVGGGSKGGHNEVILNINGREFARAIYNDQKAVAREHGVSLVANA